MVSSDELIRLIDIALAKPAPRLISRSGESAEDVDCFVVHLELDGSEYNVDSRDGHWLVCRLWDEEAKEFHEPVQLSIFDAWRAKPDIRHFIGNYDVRWTDWSDFRNDQRVKLVYIKIALKRAYELASQLRSRFRKVVTVERHTVLKAVWELQLEHDHPVGAVAVLAKVHGVQIFSHPFRQHVSTRMRLQLKGLVDTGELRNASNIEYVVTGVGISALERFEEEESRHRDAVRTQKIMLWLTLILMISAVVQAGLVKVPALVHIKEWGWPW